MKPNKIRILSTRLLEPDIIARANEYGIIVDSISFIEVNSIGGEGLQNEIIRLSREAKIVAFTSIHAVEAVRFLLGGLHPEWRIYCVGEITRQGIADAFGAERIIGSANNAMALAMLIASDSDARSIVYFCGNIRREDLSNYLTEQDIAVQEEIVYETLLTPHTVSGDHAAILFYSPSGVKSFFTNNHPATSMILFAIGDTTAVEIKKHCNNKIIVTEKPTVENIIDTMIAYFQTYANH